MKFLPALLILLVGCAEKRVEKAPEYQPLIIPPAIPVVVAEPEQPEFVEVEPRAKFTICWMWDREDGIFAYPDERVQHVALTLAEALGLGIPENVWFYALQNDENVIFLLQRHKS